MASASSPLKKSSFIHPYQKVARDGRLCTVGKFLEPSEKEFTDYMNAHGILWRYEPVGFITKFHYERINEKWIRVHGESFTPDFILPEFGQQYRGLYVEVTSMKPSLRTLKNGKIRRMKRRYPEFDITLLDYYRGEIRFFDNVGGEYGIGSNGTVFDNFGDLFAYLRCTRQKETEAELSEADLPQAVNA